MSDRLINHSSDVMKLRNDGYEVQIMGNYLLVHNVPYLNSEKLILHGTLVTNVSIANNEVSKPDTHVIHFIGELPCNVDGSVIAQILNASRPTTLLQGLIINHTFSNKPIGGYNDYYEKITAYVRIISAPARNVDGDATAQTFKVLKPIESDSVFHYSDTNSSKAKIDAINQKLANMKVGIIGLGGTGSYILDFVAKTLVGQIHLFDGDKFLQHNAFRAPGAPSIECLKESIFKVEYFKSIYSNMHKHVIPHAIFVNETNLRLLNNLDFVFISIDKSAVKELIFQRLEELEIPFIDTGIDVSRENEFLMGMVRTTMNTELRKSSGRVSFVEAENEGEYSSNIQIAEINALNAIFAVIKWKKYFKFYNDIENEHHSTYSIDVNHIGNYDCST